MGKPIIEKLRSNKGASLSMALLLFLVCAVIGAVVLTAATASAGRMSGLVESDQRYYKVSSAAELLEDLLCGKEVKIVRTKTTLNATETPYTVSIVDGAENVSPGTPVDNVEYNYKTTVGSVEYSSPDYLLSTADLSFLTARAVHLLFGSASCNNEAAMGYSFSNSESGGKFTVSHSDSSLDAEVFWSMKSDGTLVLRITDGAEKDSYSVILTLIPEVNETEKTTSSDGTRTRQTSSGYIQTYERTTVLEETSVIKWSVGSLRKEASATNETNP
ncbi:MAG: hypothetical protein IJV00_07235 [Clostridia bacterium]|nr:hypothetical protein [Clostridia bacterium]